MAIQLEDIRFAGDECFRLLSWADNTDELEVLRPGGLRESMQGMGARWHYHPEMQLTLFERGAGIWHVGDHVGPFGAMDSVLLGSHLPHCWIEDSTTSGYIIQFTLGPEHPVWHLGGGEGLRRLCSAAERGLHFDESTARSVLQLVRCMEGASSLVRAGLFLEVLGALAESHPGRKTILSQMRSLPQSSVRPHLQTVIQWALENFTEPITLDEAIGRSAMSRATFCRQFSRHTGKTFTTFVTDVRLARAHQLLVRTDRSITDIAFSSGFGSLTRFNAAFRKKFGRTPRDVR